MEATILFTDIEGSTRLARALGPDWPEVVAAHHRLVGGAIEAAGGHVERTAGDSFFALFSDPAAAVAAAAQAQQDLADYEWPEAAGELRVRMGIHTGAIDRSAGELTGLDIHLAARVEAAANGGQVVLTARTKEAVGGSLELASLGDHRLKDFPRPERLFQLVHDGRGPDAFPPLRTEPVRPTNLPAETRALIGREAELAALRALFIDEGERLVTLLGLGGTGKTRLALAAGAELLSDFNGGVWLVPLAGVQEAGAVMPAIAAALGVPDDPTRPPDGLVTERLRTRRTLLVLDNLEQLVDAAGDLAALLDAAPGCRLLVTSQLPLRIEREHVLRLDPLRTDAAMELFARRARAALPAFDLDAEREAVEAICTRVDGMPLAVELAAARVAVLPPRELLAHLDRSLGVLARGPRDLAERHRSLRSTLDWTFGLLEPGEQTLLVRLSAFAGPAPLDAVEAVAGSPEGAPPVDVLDALAGLIDASLVRRWESRAHGLRFGVPQAVRDFATEKLEESGEEVAVRSAHAAHVAHLAEACRFWYPGHTDVARARVLALHDEQRPALVWSREHDPDLHLRVVSGLCGVLTRTGRANQARAELESAFERHDVQGPLAGWAACVQAWLHLDLELEPPGYPCGRVEEGLAALRAAGDEELLELGLHAAAVVYEFSGDAARAGDLSGEALSIARRRGDTAALGAQLVHRAQTFVEMGRLAEAEALLDEAVALLPLTGDSTLAETLDTVRGDLAVAREDWPLAARCYAASAMAADRMGSIEQVLIDLAGVGMALARLGSAEAAVEVRAFVTLIEDESGEVLTWPRGSRAQMDAALSDARASLAAADVHRVMQGARSVPASERTDRAAELAARTVADADRV